LASLIDSKIATCKSWNDFEQLVAAHSKTKDKGDLFERLTQLFLQTSPAYNSKVKNVWWCNNPFKQELPSRVSKKLKMPEDDEGIDLICETFDGTYWSVQAKYRTDSDKALTTKELSKFLSLSFVTCSDIELGLVTHTSTKPVRKQKLMGNTREIGLQNFLEMTPKHWKQIADICKENTVRPPKKRNPRRYQKLAITRAVKHFKTEGNSRGKLIMPCGTGKSLMAYWIARALDAKSVVLAVPSLALVKQSLGDWTAEFLAEGVRPQWLAVCSDDSVGSMKEADSTVSNVYEAGIPTTTDQKEIIKFLRKKQKNPKIIFTTYQSGEVLAKACSEAKYSPDLLIADEAHKTVGSTAKKFATLLSDENIKIKKRLFMTATERVLSGAGDGEVASMDKTEIYGDVFHQMSFFEAIDKDIICDYKILTLFVSENKTADLISQKTAAEAERGNKKIETDAHSLAVGVAVEKAFKKYGIRKAISFHSSIKRAENFVAQQRDLGSPISRGIEIEYQTISSKQSAGQRSKLLYDFASQGPALLSNARCLTEGVDIPSIDCVIFADPKQSVVDIVQAAGRAMRQAKEAGKELGYILLPISVPNDTSMEEFTETTEFNAVSRVITALSTQDERIVDELNTAKSSGGGTRIIIDGENIDKTRIGLSEFSDHIKTQIWKPVGKANFLPFEEAKRFIQAQGVSSAKEFFAWAKSVQRPANFPSSPHLYYKDTGWKGYGDFLGTGVIATYNREYLEFEEAKRFIQSTDVKTQKEFSDWAKSDQRPANFPASPYHVYEDKGWKGYGDFLGTGFIATFDREYLGFEEAKKFIQSTNIKSQKEFKEWAKSDQRPSNFPSEPHRTYRDNGWKGLGDFLGTGVIASTKKVFLEFKEAKKFIQAESINSVNEFREWAKSDQRPSNFPAAPERIYRDTGWRSFGDFLGTGVIAPYNREFMSFEEARKFIQAESICSVREFREWTKSAQLPADFPARPDIVYEDKGWRGFGDFLGTGFIATYNREFMSFEEAKKFIQSTNVKSRTEFREWTKSDQRPSNFPSQPNRTYRDTGWRGLGDFLGTGNVSNRDKTFLEFKEAKKFIQSTNVKSRTEFRVWAKSDQRPANFPSGPEQVYKDKGWKGFGDFLGTGNTRPGSKWQREEDPET
jgi:superfamily II DNA or RNA helicase